MANDNPNISESRTQCNQIKAWLEGGNTITSLEALKRFGCMRLASRIWDLRDRGMDIGKRRVVTPTGKTVVEYYLNDNSKEAV